MADFADFELKGVDVTELAFGLLPEMSEVFGATLEQDRLVDSLGDLARIVGNSKVLQDNVTGLQQALGPDEYALQVTADWVERSGVQTGLDRSLWTPAITTPDDVKSIIVTGTTANGQDRVASLLEKRASADGTPSTTVYLPIGNRVMDSGLEKTNANIEQMYDVAGRYPTEAEYADHVVRPVLVQAGYKVAMLPQNEDGGSKIADSFVAEHPEVFEDKVAFARVANGGVLLAVQFRQAARRAGIAFDVNPDAPQAFVLTDTLPVARNKEQQGQSTKYQNPLTAARQIVITARAIQQCVQADSIDK